MGVLILLVIAAYLWGAIPLAYLVARYRKGIDIRRYGSGNVGASDIVEHVGWRIGLTVGIFDAIGKGTLTIVFARFLGLDLLVQVWMGLAAIVGHNWSAYLRLMGGRGIATSLGVLLGLGLLWELPVWVAFITFGWFARRDTALWVLVGSVILPFISATRGQPTEIVWMLSVAVMIIVVKRAMANWEPPQSDRIGRVRVFANRILWDRDDSIKENWTMRRPVP